MLLFPLFLLQLYIWPKVVNRSHFQGSNHLWNPVLGLVKGRKQLPVPAVSTRSHPHARATAIHVVLKGGGSKPAPLAQLL